MTYLAVIRETLERTRKEKSSNTLRVLYGLLWFPSGATYTQLLNFAPAFNQSALSRTLKNLEGLDLIEYSHDTKIYKTKFFFDIEAMEKEKVVFLSKLLKSTLIGANVGLLRIAIFLIAVDHVHIAELASETYISEHQTMRAIDAITSELGTQIILYDTRTGLVSANLKWFH